MDGLVRCRRQMLQIWPRQRHDIHAAHRAAAHLKQAHRQSVFAGFDVFLHIPARHERSQQPVRRARMQSDCGGQVAQRHAARCIGQRLNNIKQPVDRLHGECPFSMLVTFPNLSRGKDMLRPTLV